MASRPPKNIGEGKAKLTFNQRANDFLFLKLAGPGAIAYFLIALVFAVFAVIDSKPVYWLFAGGGVAVTGFLLFVRSTYTPFSELVLQKASAPINPLQDALITLDHIEMDRLWELASQRNILPAPARKERSRGRIRSASAGVAAGPGHATVGGEVSDGEMDVFELRENRIQLLRDLVGTLADEDRLYLDIAIIPRVSVAAPLDKAEIERLIHRELTQRVTAPDFDYLPAEIASALEAELPLSRLAAAKERELKRLAPGAFVLIESEWVAYDSDDEVHMVLAALHKPGEIPARARDQMSVPDSINVQFSLRKAELDELALARLKDRVQAGVFASVLSVESGSVELWSLAVFSRAPATATESGGDWDAAGEDHEDFAAPPADTR